MSFLQQVFAVACRDGLLGSVHHDVLSANCVDSVRFDRVLDVSGHYVDFAALHHDDGPLPCVVCG